MSAPSDQIVITIDAADAHLLLAILADARKGQPFPVAVYKDGRARISRIFGQVNDAITGGAA